MLRTMQRNWITSATLQHTSLQVSAFDSNWHGIHVGRNVICQAGCAGDSSSPAAECMDSAASAAYRI